MGSGELVFKGLRLLGLQEGTVLEMDGGNSCTKTSLYLLSLGFVLNIR